MIDTTPFRRKLLDLAITGKLVPKQGEWRTVKLGEVADVQLGKRICSKTDSGRPYKFLANINVRWGEFDLSNLKETLFTEKEAAQFTLRKGDLLVCEGGVPGRCAVWQSEPTDIKFQMALHRIRPGTLLTAEYLRYYFEAVHGTLAFRQYFIGCTISHLTKEILVKLPIPLPPLAEQKAIVKRLEELLKLEGEIAAESAALDDLITAAKRKVLDLAIRGKLVPQDPADEPASELLKRIAAKRETQVSTDRRSRSKGSSVIFRGADRSAYETRDGKTVCIDDEIPFDIPDSWAWARLGDIFQHNTGKALNRKSSEGEFREYITTSNVYWEEFKLDSLKSMRFTEDELDKCTIKEGDLLVCEGGDIGRAAIWNLKREVCIQNHLHRLRPFAEICRPYFCCVLHYYKYTNRIQGKGIGLQGLSSGMLHNLLIPIPPLEEQKRIVTKVEEIRNLIELITRT